MFQRSNGFDADLCRNGHAQAINIFTEPRGHIVHNAGADGKRDSA